MSPKTINNMLDDMNEYFDELLMDENLDTISYFRFNKYKDTLSQIRRKYNNSVNDLFEEIDVEEVLYCGN